MICGMVAMKGQVAAAAGLIHEPLQRFHEAQLAVGDMEPSVITMALQNRFRSREEAPFGDKLLAAMRNQFGGHAVKGAK